MVNVSLPPLAYVGHPALAGVFIGRARCRTTSARVIFSIWMRDALLFQGCSALSDTVMI